MANTPPLKLTRNQLAAFLKDHESIKAFENLFNLTEAIAPEAVQDALVAAESAGASANQAQALALQAANDALSTAAVAEARASVALQTANDARTMAELASTTPLFVMPPGSMGRYAQFLDTTTQTAATANTAYPITYDTVSLSCGIRLKAAAPSEIQVVESGIYNVQFSVQLDKTSGGTARFWIWFRVNGVDVPNSASEVHIQGNNHEIFSAANILLPLLAGDYVQLMWSVSDTSVQLASRLVAAPVPAVPSVIVTLTNVVSPACAITQSPPIDTLFASVVLLLHGDASFVDSSLAPKTLTVFPGAVINTTIKRFGAGAIDIPGAGYASTPHTTDFEWWTADTTMECWVYSRGGETIFGQTSPTINNTSWLFGLNSSRQVNLFWWTGVANNVTGTTALAANTWHHIAVSIQGATIRVFANGVLEATGTRTTPVTIAEDLVIGRAFGVSRNFLFDDIRVTRGHARYTANFTPPTAPFPDVGP